MMPGPVPTPERTGGHDPPQGISLTQAALGSESQSRCALVGTYFWLPLVHGVEAPRLAVGSQPSLSKPNHPR